MLDQVSPMEHGILPLDASLSEPRTEHPGDVRCTESTTKTAPLSVPGLVDAILEVSRQRKTILDQVRSALLSGNDMEALQLVELCEFGIRARFISPSAFGFGAGAVAGGACLPSAVAGSAHCAAVVC